jgi:hypothetical protein
MYFNGQQLDVISLSGCFRLRLQILFISLLLYSKGKGVHSSGVQSVFWLLLVLCEAIRFRTVLLDAYSEVLLLKEFLYQRRMIIELEIEFQMITYSLGSEQNQHSSAGYRAHILSCGRRTIPFTSFRRRPANIYGSGKQTGFSLDRWI